ncbi:MAG: histidine phosphatase family protein, partial [Methylococcaceae bacterium]
MLQLTLIRHAKSSWGDTALSDFDRPLNERGLRDIALMGNILNEKLAIFDQLISSPAKRAITTSKLFAEKLGHPEKDIKLEQQLYNASLHTLLKVIHQLDSTVKHCVLV